MSPQEVMNLEQWIRERTRRGTFAAGQDLSLTQPLLRRGNVGLWFDRFGAGWETKTERNGQPRYRLNANRQDWVKELHEKRVGVEAELGEYAARVAALTRQRGGAIKRFALPQWGRFVTGVGLPHPIENGFTWHRTLGVPYLPGSGVKGMTLAWARDWLSEPGEKLRRIFGYVPKEAEAVDENNFPRMGSVVFLDAVPCEPPTVAAEILSPHGSGQGPPEDAGKVNPIPFLAVRRGVFSFAVMPAKPRPEMPASPLSPEAPAPDQAAKDCAEALRWIGQALETIGAGAKTKSGYGRFAAQPAGSSACDTTS